MNDEVNADIPAGNEVLLRRLFQDPALHDSRLPDSQDAAQPAVPDEHFVQKVMQDVRAVQHRELLFRIIPAVMTFVGAVLLLSWMLTPFFIQLPALFIQFPALFSQQLPSLLATAWSGAWSALTLSPGSGNLIPLLVLLLALLIPALVDRLPRILKL